MLHPDVVFIDYQSYQNTKRHFQQLLVLFYNGLLLGFFVFIPL